jgi:hypothetical protein
MKLCRKYSNWEGVLAAGLRHNIMNLKVLLATNRVVVTDEIIRRLASGPSMFVVCKQRWPMVENQKALVTMLQELSILKSS